FALTPPGRGVLRQGPVEPIGAGWGWSIAMLGLLVTARLHKSFFESAVLPPHESTNHVDMWWHLSLVEELLRPGPPQIPQAVGEPLQYHYFSHVDMAVASAVTRIDPATVVFRLWPAAAAVLAIAVIAVSAE